MEAFWLVAAKGAAGRNFAASHDLIASRRNQGMAGNAVVLDVGVVRRST